MDTNLIGTHICASTINAIIAAFASIASRPITACPGIVDSCSRRTTASRTSTAYTTSQTVGMGYAFRQRNSRNNCRCACCNLSQRRNKSPSGRCFRYVFIVQSYNWLHSEHLRHHLLTGAALYRYAILVCTYICTSAIAIIAALALIASRPIAACPGIPDTRSRRTT